MAEYLVTTIDSPSMADLQSHLDSQKGSPVTLRIQSAGGDVLPAIAAANAIARHGQVTAIADGQAASAATVLLASAKTARAVETATLMMHAPHVTASGDSESMRSTAQALDAASAAMRQVYSGKIKDSAALDSAMSGTATWMTATEAKALGLVDELVPPGDLQASAFSVGLETDGICSPPSGPAGIPAAPSFPAQAPMGFRTNSIDGRIRAASDAIMIRAGKLADQPSNPFRGMRMDAMPAAIQASGGPFPQTVTSLPGILSDASNRILSQAFQNAEEVWPRICRSVQVVDFRPVSLASLSVFPSAQRLNENTEIEFVNLKDTYETGALTTVGHRFAISRRALVNDDVMAFANLAAQLGASCSRAVGDDLATMVTTGTHGVTLKDGRALFGTDPETRGNATSTAISSAGLSATHTQLSLMRDPSGVIAGLQPNALWIPISMLPYARSVMASEYQVAAPSETLTQATSQPNAARGLFETANIYADWRLDGSHDGQAWYMLRAGQDTSAFVVLTLESAPTPMLDESPILARDSYEWRVLWDAKVLPVSFTLIARGGV